MTTIAQERAGLAAIGLRLRRREEAGFRHNYTTARAVTEPAIWVFVHITVTNPNSYGSDDAHARAVESIGISRFGSGASYNRLHMRSGRAYEGQPIGRRGTHTGSYSGSCAESGCPSRGGNVTSSNHNVTGRGYVICQNVGDSVTDAEFDALARSVAADQLAGFVVRGAPIHGHRCVSDKSCPGPLMWVFMGELERLVDHYLRNGLPGDDMTPEQATQLDDLHKRLGNVSRPVDGKQYWVNNALGEMWDWVSLRTPAQVAALEAKVDALAAGSGTTPEELAAITAAAQAGATAAWDPQALADALDPLLPDVEVTDLVTALRTVLAQGVNPPA